MAIDSIALQNRQKEMKAVLEEKQKEYQTTDGAEKEKAETDFRKEKIDTFYAGVYKNCGNLEFLKNTQCPRLQAASYEFNARSRNRAANERAV